MRRTESQIKEWILRTLGVDTVGVELKDDHLGDAITDAKIWWQSGVGQAKSILLTLSDTTEYAESLIATDVDSVVDVVFEVTNQSMTDLFAWADVEINPYTWVFGDSSGGVSNILEFMMHRELMKQVVSAEKGWEWDRSQRKLIITPVPESGSQVLVTYISTDVDLDYLTNYEMYIFRQYALSQSMKTLARIRMKYSEKPGATGSFSMDGDAMYANGEAIEEKMEEKMRMLQSPVGFFAS